MSNSISFLLNGRVTGASALVKKKIAHALAASSEYNSNNSWNVNFSSGNMNNNNKYNTNYVRAVAALSEEEIQGWLEAFEDCCISKKTSDQCILYRYYYEEDLLHLAAEVQMRIYEPSFSICFIVTRPKLREVFAANFRDRIVQHWICIRLNPLFEERFCAQGNVSYNCRVGFGTLYAVTDLSRKIEKVSLDYTREAYIGKFDIHSFFMSIDRGILLVLLLKFIDEKYFGPDKETLIYLCKVVINHASQNNCIRRGNLDLWEQLAKSKSLFYAKEGIGMPIGNLTSQLLANFYMSFFDEWILAQLAPYNGEYARFVDDFVIVVPSTEAYNGKEVVKMIHKRANTWLSEQLHLTLHPDKVYIQDAKKGVKFVGSVIKPHRIYTSNRTMASLRQKVAHFEEYCHYLTDRGCEHISIPQAKILEHEIDSMNSYLGISIHTNSYAIRAHEIMHNFKYFWIYCYVEGHFAVVKLKNKYKLINRLIENENMDLRDGASQSA